MQRQHIFLTSNVLPRI